VGRSGVEPPVWGVSDGREWTMVSATMVVATMPVSDLGKARVFWFRDPDGNTLGLRQG